MMETSVWGRDTIFITPWRHMKLTGAVTLDAGVHNADIMQYYFGVPASAFGQGRLFETTRRKAPGAGPGNFWEAWVKDFPDVIKPTGEDAMFGTINFRNGAVAQWVFHNGGHGQPFHHRMVFGSARFDRRARRPQRTAGASLARRRDRYRRRARARIRAELPIVAGCGRALRRASESGNTISILSPPIARSSPSSTTNSRSACGPARGRKSMAQWPSARSPWSIRCSNPRSRAGR